MDEFDGGFNASSQKPEYTGIKTLRCITAKHISSMPVEDSSSILMVDRFEISNIQACGFISSIKKISTGYVFEIFDTTGKIDCAFWINSTYEELMAERITEGSLVKVVGVIKTFGNKKTLNITNIATINVNTLIHHLTSCLYQHLFFNNKIERTDEKRGGGSMLSRIQNDILDVYRNNQDHEGLPIEIVVSMLRDKYTENDIRSNIDGLITNCHLYSVEGTSYKTTI